MEQTQKTKPDQKTKLGEVAEAIGQHRIDECKQALLEFATSGDLFDIAADELASHRGFPYAATSESDEAYQRAHDAAFFDVLDATVESLRRTWGGYYSTLKSN